MSQTDALNALRFVDANTSRKISDGHVFDLNNPVDEIDWEWVKHNKEIGEDIHAAESDNHILYYIEKLDAEIDKRLAKVKVLRQAYGIIENASDQERKDLCKYLGQDVSVFRPKDIEDYLMTKAEKTPALILKAKADPNYKTRVFLYKLVEAKKIKIDKSGIYKYGEIILGLNLDAAIYWLNDTKNRVLVGKLFSEIEGSDNVPFSNVVDDFTKDENGLVGGESAKILSKELVDEDVI